MFSYKEENLLSDRKQAIVIQNSKDFTVEMRLLKEVKRKFGTVLDRNKLTAAVGSCIYMRRGINEVFHLISRASEREKAKAYHLIDPFITLTERCLQLNVKELRMPTIVNHKFKWFKIKVPISNHIFRYAPIKITVCIMNKVKNGNNERQPNEIVQSGKANDNESACPDVQQTAVERGVQHAL